MQMACMQLGSKPEQFHLVGYHWVCTTGLPSDASIEIGETSFHVHKFPLLSRSGVLEKRIEELSCRDGLSCVLQLHDIPGGAKAFELITKFCYGVKMDVTALNVISLRCAAEFLQMTEDHGEGNLISQTECFLNEVFANWTDSMKALESCEVVFRYAEDLNLISRCIDSLAIKACTDPSLCSMPVSQSKTQSPVRSDMWNGITTAAKPQPITYDWWYEDVSCLNLALYKRLIQAVEMKGMKPESICGSLIFYAKRYLPLMSTHSSFKNPNHADMGTTVSILSEGDQRCVLEEIVGLLPNHTGVTSAKLLLRMLRTAMVLHATPSCRENLERRVGAQLDQACLEDILIPNMRYSVETLHDIDCIQRILDYFMLMDQAAAASNSPSIVEEGQLADGSHSLTPITAVANLVDEFLAEVATDVNLKLPKFQSLAGAIPDYARPISDGIYHAIDVYLKAHPWLTDSEREQICKLMNCQKLSLEASIHAAQNERISLRVIVQVLFFEQLRLRTSVSSWFFVSDSLENSQLYNGNLTLAENDGFYKVDHGGATSMADVKERVVGLEKDCLGMKQELQRIVKTKKGWSLFPKRFSLGILR